MISSGQTNWQIQAHATPISSFHIPAMTLPRNQYVAIAEQDATDAGIPPIYFECQINLASGFNPNAFSPFGAVDIIQFTAAGLGIDPWDPIQALQAAAQMMANSYYQYGHYKLSPFIMQDQPTCNTL